MVDKSHFKRAFILSIHFHIFVVSDGRHSNFIQLCSATSLQLVFVLVSNGGIHRTPMAGLEASPDGAIDGKSGP